MDPDYVPKLVLNAGIEEIPSFQRKNHPQLRQPKLLSFHCSVTVGDASFTLCFFGGGLGNTVHKNQWGKESSLSDRMQYLE